MLRVIGDLKIQIIKVDAQPIRKDIHVGYNAVELTYNEYIYTQAYAVAYLKQKRLENIRKEKKRLYALIKSLKKEAILTQDAKVKKLKKGK